MFDFKRIVLRRAKQHINGFNLQVLIGSSLSLTASVSGSCCYWLYPLFIPDWLSWLLHSASAVWLAEHQPRHCCDLPLVARSPARVFSKYCSCFGNSVKESVYGGWFAWVRSWGGWGVCLATKRPYGWWHIYKCLFYYTHTWRLPHTCCAVYGWVRSRSKEASPRGLVCACIYGMFEETFTASESTPTKGICIWIRDNSCLALLT